MHLERGCNCFDAYLVILSFVARARTFFVLVTMFHGLFLRPAPCRELGSD